MTPFKRLKLHACLPSVAMLCLPGTVAHAQQGEGAFPPLVAPTPPMGWNPWNAFRTDVDEKRIFQAAQSLLDLGLAGLGYRYVNIDDGWALKRDHTGTLQVRVSTFPSARLAGGATSFRPFVDRLHAMGLKAGIYSDIGRNTCAQFWDAGHPNLPEGTRAEREVGTLGFQNQDAQLFFDRWGFDYVKLDACGVADYAPGSKLVTSETYRPYTPLIKRENPHGSSRERLEALYAGFAKAARRASPGPGPVIAICAWGEADVADWANRHGNLWRTSPDIWKTWESMLRNFDSAAPRALFAGPGRWNDPDMLEIGNGDFGDANLEQARAHMSLWAIISAPLILSYDLSRSSPALLSIVANKDVIGIDQDPAGNQGVIIYHEGDLEIIVKQLADGTKAVAVINRGSKSLRHSLPVSELRFDPAAPVEARDLWKQASHPAVGGEIDARLGPRETLLLRVRGAPLHADRRYLDEMPARVMVSKEGYKPADRGLTKPWIPARIGYLPSGEPIETEGGHDRNALGSAAGSEVTIDLQREFTRFKATPGRNGTVTILGDGRVLYRSKGARAEPIDIAIKGIQTLTLVNSPKESQKDSGVRILNGVSLTY